MIWQTKGSQVQIKLIIMLAHKELVNFHCQIEMLEKSSNF